MIGFSQGWLRSHRGLERRCGRAERPSGADLAKLALALHAKSPVTAWLPQARRLLPRLADASATRFNCIFVLPTPWRQTDT